MQSRTLFVTRTEARTRKHRVLGGFHCEDHVSQVQENASKHGHVMPVETEA